MQLQFSVAYCYNSTFIHNNRTVKSNSPQIYSQKIQNLFLELHKTIKFLYKPILIHSTYVTNLLITCCTTFLPNSNSLTNIFVLFYPPCLWNDLICLYNNMCDWVSRVWCPTWYIMFGNYLFSYPTCISCLWCREIDSHGIYPVWCLSIIVQCPLVLLPVLKH